MVRRSDIVMATPHLGRDHVLLQTDGKHMRLGSWSRPLTSLVLIRPGTTYRERHCG